MFFQLVTVPAAAKRYKTELTLKKAAITSIFVLICAGIARCLTEKIIAHSEILP
jgi:hypothetical protein